MPIFGKIADATSSTSSVSFKRPVVSIVGSEIASALWCCFLPRLFTALSVLPNAIIVVPFFALDVVLVGRRFAGVVLVVQEEEEEEEEESDVDATEEDPVGRHENAPIALMMRSQKMCACVLRVK
jgi:uncharacterized membrane protein